MFQVRRRRAAKLTNFFGVEYRELMSEVLESIEKGIEEESGRGTLKPDEIQVRIRCLSNCGSSCIDICSTGSGAEVEKSQD